MRSPRLTCVLGLVLVLTLSLSMTSCGGGGSGGGDGDLVLLGFNYPNVAGVVLNAPLIFTFSANVAPGSITPDTLRVVGATAPTFETTVVDGNLVALIPTIPNFEDYRDAGFAPSTAYTVSLAQFPAPSTIETPSGKSLQDAESFTFATVVTNVFMEHRRPIIHGVPPSQGGKSDDEGCLQNSQNALFEPPGVKQTNLGTTLLCLMNEGPPRVVEGESIPRFGQTAVGTPNAIVPGLIDLPPIRMRFNEALDPLSVVPIVQQKAVNIQLWRVGDKDGNPVVGGPKQVDTNQPLIVQSLDQVEIILVASNAVQQGVYCVVARSALRDLALNPLRVDDDEPPGIYQIFDDEPLLPQGWRLYFETLDIPTTPLALSEEFSGNQTEWGDLDSADTEPGIYEVTGAPSVAPGTTNLRDPIAALDTSAPATATQPVYELLHTVAGCGVTTTANWNLGDGTGYRFLNLPGLIANPDAGGGPDELRAVYRPYTGTGGDGSVDTDSGIFTNGPGDVFSFDTDGGSTNGDGVWEYEDFHLRPGDTAVCIGSAPVLILCRGDFIVDGHFSLDGDDGEPGLNTDGTSLYDNDDAVNSGGAGGAGSAGGGNGGAGANPKLSAPPEGTGANGAPGRNLFGEDLIAAVDTGGGGAFGDGSNSGGGGGGFGGAGGGGGIASGGVQANGGDAFNDDFFTRDVDMFTPDRGFFPFANISGGSGGGGGGADDDNENGTAFGTPMTNGDDGGGGGGGAGGGLWVIADTVSVPSGGLVSANGGDGGNTYSEVQHQLDVGPDGDPNTADDFVSGILDISLLLPPNDTPQGEGGPGGGGSGGGIFLVGVDSCTVAGTIEALGGAGGVCGIANMNGQGGGGDGRIVLMTFDSAAAAPVTAGATFNAASIETTDRYTPTVANASVGQSEWIDLAAGNADFNPEFPEMSGTFNPPLFASNAFFLTNTGGLDEGPAGTDHFEIIWEFQGCDILNPVLGPPFDTGTGCTAWSTSIDDIDLKRYIRWRFRFAVRDNFPAYGLGALPLPKVLNLVIPYITN